MALYADDTVLNFHIITNNETKTLNFHIITNTNLTNHDCVTY